MLPEIEHVQLLSDCLTDAADHLAARAPVGTQPLLLKHLPGAVSTLLDAAVTYYGEAAVSAARENRALIRQYVSRHAVDALVRLFLALEDDAPPLPAQEGA